MCTCVFVVSLTFLFVTFVCLFVCLAQPSCSVMGRMPGFFSETGTDTGVDSGDAKARMQCNAKTELNGAETGSKYPQDASQTTGIGR